MMVYFAVKILFFYLAANNNFFLTVQLKWSSWNITIIAQKGVWGGLFFVLTMYRKPL